MKKELNFKMIKYYCSRRKHSKPHNKYKRQKEQKRNKMKEKWSTILTRQRNSWPI